MLPTDRAWNWSKTRPTLAPPTSWRTTLSCASRTIMWRHCATPASSPTTSPTRWDTGEMLRAANRATHPWAGPIRRRKCFRTGEKGENCFLQGIWCSILLCSVGSVGFMIYADVLFCCLLVFQCTLNWFMKSTESLHLYRYVIFSVSNLIYTFSNWWWCSVLAFQCVLRVLRAVFDGPVWRLLQYRHQHRYCLCGDLPAARTGPVVVAHCGAHCGASSSRTCSAWWSCGTLVWMLCRSSTSSWWVIWEELRGWGRVVKAVCGMVELFWQNVTTSTIS